MLYCQPVFILVPFFHVRTSHSTHFSCPPQKLMEVPLYPRNLPIETHRIMILPNHSVKKNTCIYHQIKLVATLCLVVFTTVVAGGRDKVVTTGCRDTGQGPQSQVLCGANL